LQAGFNLGIAITALGCTVKFEPSPGHSKTTQKTLGCGTAIAWISNESDDGCWDQFLQETSLGQFQQSTIWARAKYPEGWKPIRVLVTIDGELVAGFQMLTISSWRGRMGYVSKGPVVLPGYDGLTEYVTELLRKLAQKERLMALFVQPPDLCVATSETLTRNGFLPDMLAKVNDATWIVNLSGGFEAVERRMDAEGRRKARQAVNRGLRIREGAREDLNTFFDLMLSTCRRQGVDPNPPDVSHLLALWDAASPSGCIKLFFAEYEGILLTGYVDISFGKTVTQWKKGWNFKEGQRNPNDLITYEALKRGSRTGYQSYDFASFDRQMAVAILEGRSLSAEQDRSRYVFFTRFGGGPRLLPEAQVYFPNPVIRSAYRVYFHKRIRQSGDEWKVGRGSVNNCDQFSFAETRKQ
jgi:CelD/BcsL family acetyltransferase involved in cellulose biosynthesis